MDENNGGLRFLPCSHREPLNSDLWNFGLHGSNETDIKDYQSKSGLEIDQVPSYYCRTNPGDMVIFNLKIWHSSLGGGKNRRNITINYSKYPEKESESESLKALAIQSKQTMKRLNFPAPQFNRPFYESTDEVVCISKVTHKILQEVSPNVSSCYLPHAVNGEVFRPAKTAQEKEQVQDVRNQIIDASFVLNSVFSSKFLSRYFLTLKSLPPVLVSSPVDRTFTLLQLLK